MAHVTYLLGAGASKNAIPIVNEMEVEIGITFREFRKVLSNGNSAIKHKKFLSELERDFINLTSHCTSHSSIDTFAKKIFLIKDWARYNWLKDTLALFFTIRQCIKIPDKRYDNFWATILSSVDVMPTNIKILSWNYDFQLEASFQIFTDEKTLEASSRSLNVNSPANSYRNLSENFNVIKINGSAMSNLNDASCYLIDQTSLNPSSYIERLVERYYALKESRPNIYVENHPLTFAWENSGVMTAFKSLNETLHKTTSLVVIGYSFPVFNRKIDDFLVNRCMDNLLRVYIQSPDADEVQQRFETLYSGQRKIAYEIIKNTNQFFFPKELEI